MHDAFGAGSGRRRSRDAPPVIAIDHIRQRIRHADPELPDVLVRPHVTPAG